MIKLTRIDDRLVHGQVAFTWVPSVGCDCLLVANDLVAKDEFQKMTLNLAKPAGARLFIKSLADAIAFLSDEKNKNLKILILINSVKDAFTLAQAVAEIKSINFGGLRAREGAKPISKAISLTDEDVLYVRELQKQNLELEIRQVPTDSKQSLETLV